MKKEWIPLPNGKGLMEWRFNPPVPSNKERREVQERREVMPATLARQEYAAPKPPPIRDAADGADGDEIITPVATDRDRDRLWRRIIVAGGMVVIFAVAAAFFLLNGGGESSVAVTDSGDTATGTVTVVADGTTASSSEELLVAPYPGALPYKGKCAQWRADGTLYERHLGTTGFDKTNDWATISSVLWCEYNRAMAEEINKMDATGEVFVLKDAGKVVDTVHGYECIYALPYTTGATLRSRMCTGLLRKLRGVSDEKLMERGFSPRVDSGIFEGFPSILFKTDLGHLIPAVLEGGKVLKSAAVG